MKTQVITLLFAFLSTFLSAQWKTTEIKVNQLYSGTLAKVSEDYRVADIALLSDGSSVLITNEDTNTVDLKLYKLSSTGSIV
ncbi:MAG: hypothetical protein KDC92_06275 [Bacteroidetes bacterium]|nr:hypothetical protein [Bacteroidota bacterium]